MMDERRRFQIALGGIGASLLIAAFFVASAPPLTYPVVPAPPTPYPLPVQAVMALPEGCGHQMPAETRKAVVPRAPRLTPRRAIAPTPAGAAAIVDSSAAVAGTSAPSIPVPRPVPLGHRTMLTGIGPAPYAEAAPIIVVSSAQPFTDDDESGGRAVTGAFVTAGKEVGRGFRTAGRAIKSLF